MMPEMFMGYVERGRVHDSLGNQHAAYEDYKRALELRPDYHPGFAPFGMYAFMQEDWDSAAEMFRKAYEREPRAHNYPLLSALALKEAGREETARDYLESELSNIPRDTLYYDMARYYLTPQGDSSLLRRIERSDDTVTKTQLLFHLGALYELDGRTSLAHTMFVEVEDQGGPAVIEKRLAAWKLRSDG
jgi:lipoprotein NlpI